MSENDRAGKMIVIEKRGHWNESEVNGVECSICGEWSPLPFGACTNERCGAKLEGIKYINWPRRKPAPPRANTIYIL